MKKTISIVLVLALGLTAEVANADFTFGTPTNLGPTVNSSSIDAQPDISADGLSLYFLSRRPGGSGSADLWVTTRKAKDDPWGAPVNLGTTLNSSAPDHNPSISADGLSLYYTSRRPGGHGADDIWMTTRKTKSDPWSTPVNLGFNSSPDDWAPNISADGLELFFTCSGARGGYGSYDLYVATREIINDPWGEPVNLGPTVNSSAGDAGSSISPDGRMLFFTSDRPGGSGSGDLWVTTRATVSDPWGEPVNLGPVVNSSAGEGSPSISADGLMLYFDDILGPRPGGVGDADLWQAPIVPIVDFNGDGIVNAADMCIMVDHWGENYPLCDIGPTPLGDGVVDTQDLIVLAEHLLTYPGAVAYWKLDETEGMVAADSAGGNDAYVIGGAVWQPTSGEMNGALEFDGVDDYVITEFVLNPADGPFSVLAWIKGGAPGQVILSQIGEANWLCADPSGGNLMTELEGLGRGGNVPIVSETVITDGNWHRVGFVWDGASRILYADGVEVAIETQPGLEGSAGGLYIGAGKNLEPGSFFSGLIDDVRIYDRVITP
ncbi:hypothetical protein ES703_92173 [subsurface metagenome]